MSGIESLPAAGGQESGNAECKVVDTGSGRDRSSRSDNTTKASISFWYT